MFPEPSALGFPTRNRMSVGNIIGIMASDPNGVIGKGKDLPWHLPDEFEHFQKTTFGHVVVMGRKTLRQCPFPC